MERTILSWVLAVAIALIALPVQAQDDVKLEIVDGLYNAGLKAKIEMSTGRLLTEINRAFKENRALNLALMELSETAERGLNALWENTHFYCNESEVLQSCLNNGSGYQVRRIPLIIKPMGETLDDNYQEAVINYDANGKIERLNFTLSTTIYQDVMKKGKTVTEVARRQEILSYVEQFRTAYNEEDIVFLENIFSEDALIITGVVTKVKKTDGAGVTYDKVTYKKQGKQEYIANLKRSFAVNKWINVNFDEVKVVKHPNPKMEGFYGVTVHQLYANSSGYSDDGYLFMLWDFRNKDEVQIHVRTWQPRWMNSNRTEEIAKEEIFTTGDFVIDL
ncbi:MAG: hypothetical protein LBV32_09440 [Tannerellaceae bacterium]|jgi:hypothetical protein|nr:hypothetical protein [Tannerellaceae bacterium]